MIQKLSGTVCHFHDSKIIQLNKLSKGSPVFHHHILLQVIQQGNQHGDQIHSEFNSASKLYPSQQLPSERTVPPQESLAAKTKKQ